ncbi:MAG: hypothetical protein CL763_01815 [Chloroflexi bacterium]|nr:hypothetical protein [Chloroflexota bacterium]
MKSPVDLHLDILSKKIFQTEDKWPQFELLLTDLQELAAATKPEQIIVSLERTLLYGGYSLIAPLFSNGSFISVDCSPESAEDRGAYNYKMVDDPSFIKHQFDVRAVVDDTKIENESTDLLLIPNLVHHVADQDGMFKEAYRILKPGGTLYIFEPLVRELHQIPDDFLRYTPYGLAGQMEKFGFQVQDSRHHGGPFEVISYCWFQALEYIPEDERSKFETWFKEKHFKELMELDQKYPQNLSRRHTSFPTSFSVFAKKERL